ncbi:hypothetical protein Cob_v009917 [Colletotrichum orbiculare MAFF 240422]|uniref:Uncharacterized protein n=1 Tax=Colletotrichum orbiculare (strain 104-T / ATCC 96160 / CBS 514.97 / LARS 414 / MAFF 240422) TaxID=1213857 RepID=A0A484FJY6_COLOR|nr:hypothetical protein Cob_v009917 [Colletotrichum orbiculare MAFF 240422]
MIPLTLSLPVLPVKTGRHSGETKRSLSRAPHLLAWPLHSRRTVTELDFGQTNRLQTDKIAQLPATTAARQIPLDPKGRSGLGYADNRNTVGSPAASRHTAKGGRGMF